jgi:S1-C subfamily serine protease
MDAAKPRPSFASQAYMVIRPSVVRITTTGENAADEDEVAVGAGVIVDDNGTILTSLHVVKERSKINIRFADGSVSTATIIVAQPENDLAVLHPELIPDDLVPATLGSSEGLRVGDEVIAIGNPFGITGSLTDGVVSGLGRSFKVHKTGETLTNMIQFDAAVNPGNSGGPLVNRFGEVVGIVTGLLNPTEQDFFIGIGFAVPIETAAAAAGAPPL